MTPTTPPAVPALLGRVVDYAGLFPPAGLAMAEAVANYAAYREGPHAWLLGCFVLPFARLDEFLTAASGQHLGGEPWPLSLLVAGDVAAQVQAAERRLAGEPFALAAIECRSADLAADVAALPAHVAGFFELAPGPGLPAALAVLAAHGRCAKLRTGSVRAAEIPDAAAVAAFVDACAERAVPWKATAGLHHPLRGEHPLTYEPGAPRARMHGFLNVFLGAALRAAGRLDCAGLRAFLERDAAADFRCGGAAIVAAGHRLTLAELAAGRRLLRSFGSCSFTEPIADLATMAWL
jgi:hypothetical protein